jgi:glycosyltransferase involved in cell wall biosynthesis
MSTRKKILFVTKHYFPGAGDRTYMLALEKILRNLGGHEVGYFAMQYPENLPSPFSKYFVDNIEYGSLKINPSTAVKVLGRSLYCREAQKKIAALIEDFRPDIVHIQHLDTHITCSILPVIRRYGIPIVWHLHIYAPLCVNYNLVDEQARAICTACRKNRFWQPVLRRCKKGSLPASLMGALVQCFNHLAGFMQQVDLFICPSRFLQRTFIDFGYPADRLVHLPYFTEYAAVTPSYSGEGYGLFFGRLDFEKGVDILLEALRGTVVPFKIVGGGKLAENLQQQARQLGLQNVVFTGPLYGHDLEQMIAGAGFVVVPSRWFEVTGLVILEANAHGKPAIASRIGGIPEVIQDGRTGLLFDHASPEDLRAKILSLYQNPDQCAEMGVRARARLEAEHAPEPHYQKLMDIYNRVKDAGRQQ